ncbi:hypothetical protein EVAR_31806_1 [Eumeta japonica]|uniref:Uncharacterized protein n=1 Tax=Eumeta variegata TaxID=151549 RepID=A0A4C1W5U5_EUMVA|nr:hypothetical protein EVAR_31806_1 [Eumeta japonica]
MCDAYDGRALTAEVEMEYFQVVDKFQMHDIEHGLEARVLKFSCSSTSVTTVVQMWSALCLTVYYKVPYKVEGEELVCGGDITNVCGRTLRQHPRWPPARTTVYGYPSFPVGRGRRRGRGARGGPAAAVHGAAGPPNTSLATTLRYQLSEREEIVPRTTLRARRPRARAGRPLDCLFLLINKSDYWKESDFALLVIDFNLSVIKKMRNSRRRFFTR